MSLKLADSLFRPVARRLHRDHMARLGIRKTMRIAQAYNGFQYGRDDVYRRDLYRTQLDTLLKENGPTTRPLTPMKDGYHIDTSMSLPHLDRMLADGDAIIAERGGIRTSKAGKYRSYFQDMWTPEDYERYPSFLDFGTSSDVVSVVADYLQSIPALSTTSPSGVRLVESNAAYDDRPGNPRDSQLYHMDYYSLPNVYVLVNVVDTTPEHGPWTFYPRSKSDIVREKLGYWGGDTPYRLSDEQVYSVLDPKDAIPFCYPRGTVLFIESSGCLHYGSRNSMLPRFTAMLAYTGACRTDLTEAFAKPRRHPIKSEHSRLRKMLCDKYQRF